MWSKVGGEVYYTLVYPYRFGPGFGDDDEEANLFGMYGTPEDKAKMVCHFRYSFWFYFNSSVVFVHVATGAEEATDHAHNPGSALNQVPAHSERSHAHHP